MESIGDELIDAFESFPIFSLPIQIFFPRSCSPGYFSTHPKDPVQRFFPPETARSIVGDEPHYSEISVDN